MSETPQKSIYRLRRESIARAIAAWQAGTEQDASTLEDRLMDEGLLILPRAVGTGNWRVLVDGKPATYPGQDRLAGPVDAEAAAEIFLVEVSKAEATDISREITVRPATDQEQTRHALLGDARVEEPVLELAATAYLVTQPVQGEPWWLLSYVSDDGSVVRVRLAEELAKSLAESLHDDAQGGGQ